ncbi:MULTISPECIES: DUF2975 domain-containing protein [Flagellimonas]|uniref:DUF2975 domain-containing protein n=1 Tax=Flagellimonas hadalis TaxID=2597517 RepID=A0A5N5INV7_9FLAO|nr:DUF2975 domain-containing protein [Allomuricauda hadalis]KAB5488342.1 DUF2975 domain-containing protein [Allomuricauda hadalis]RUA14496.1 MAG: DUF2975 domain-containing protein [Flavobacteriia bacterium]
MKTKNLVFKGMKIISWIIFIGLSIEAGALVVNFIFSLFRPEAVQNLYQKLDMSDVYQSSKLTFVGMYGFILTIAILKAVMFYIVIVLATKIDLAKPFNHFVSKQIYKICYYTFSIGLLSFIAQGVTKQLEHDGFAMDRLNQFWPDGEAFILMAAVIYIIAIIFEKGVEYQEELEETV